jgi:hypothetical protein
MLLAGFEQITSFNDISGRDYLVSQMRRFVMCYALSAGFPRLVGD